MIRITRREYFNAAHRLYNPKWSAEKNWEVFGPCSRMHGHNWELFVTVEGEVEEDTGFVMDLKKLKDLVREVIIDKVDHTYLNDDVDFLKGILPSCENFAIAVWNILEPVIKERYGVQLYEIKLQETENHFAQYFGKK
ncbi:6-pyruvoyl trahydropterin synthase family protein [Jiulongibacter sediminis]|uniref:6-carboxy-5,6,7,8-tetrahydropterin synthase n=1 Tax=Jiulongibacter sediminis TaxID=1605367 RepID=A0A0P7C4R2_9BACT|nr:6-carboxytetrahydropterin synthase [Jiulongibacter sediminis]KPM46922.1 6-pyruvoyl tetrahydrobiopterin synthase [Jiulongibacter sediminis]TBX22269.1 6-pyruvoyl tetrahydrobiopterin synthase [Jiulongibacter sediminis]